MVSFAVHRRGGRSCAHAATSVLNCALFLGRILCRLGYVRVAVGALNVDSQCSWAAGTFFGQTLTMSSWLLVVATLPVYVSIGSCAIFGEISEDWVTSRGGWRSQY